MSKEEKLLHTTCPNCGAPLDYREGDPVALCVYCNTMVQLRKIKTEEEHYMLKITADRGIIRTLLVGDLLKVPGVPENIRERLQIVEAKLVYIPYYVLQVHGNLKWRGLGRQARYYGPYEGAYRNISFYLKPEAGEFDDHLVTIVYAGNIQNEVLMSYKFATRGRRFFSLGEIKSHGGVVMEPKFGFDKAREIGLDKIRQKHLQLLREELQKIEETIPHYEVTQIQLIHVPMWFIKWKIGHSKKTYKAIIDASSGLTLYTDAPRGSTYWLSVITMSVVFMMIGASPFLLDLPGALSLSIVKLAGIISGSVLSIQTFIKAMKTSFKEKME